MHRYDYVIHSGVKGMRWGERRYQNSDGSLTPLGRAHYGVGAARKKAGEIKEAIRKKVAPTNAELNAQIRKQRSKNLNKQKREELSQLKKGIDPKEKSKSEAKGTHKKFYEMSDKEIQDRINRLNNEIKLADLEFETSLGPGQRFVYNQLKAGAGEAIKNVTSSALTDAGKSLLGVQSKDGGGKKKKGSNDDNSTEATKEYRRMTEEIKARQGYEKAKKEEADAKAKEKADTKAAREARKKAEADDFRRVRDNVSEATAGYYERYARANAQKERTQQANVYSTWDPDERKDRKGYLGR